LGFHITEDVTWSLSTSHLVKKNQQRLFFQTKLQQAGLPPETLVNFYRSVIETILSVLYCVAYQLQSKKQEGPGPFG